MLPADKKLIIQICNEMNTVNGLPAADQMSIPSSKPKTARRHLDFLRVLCTLSDYSMSRTAGTH